MNKEFQTGQTDRRMPYRVPEVFFEELPQRTVERLQIASRWRKRRLRRRVAAIAIPFAACLALVMIFHFSDHQETKHAEARLDGAESFDLYLQGLSDEELTDLAAETSLDPTCFSPL